MTSYREAGVDLEGAERHVANIAAAVTSTWDDGVIGGFGGFAAGVSVPEGYRRPILMMTTDGVGTKLEIARLANTWGGVGRDLVAMCVDDLAAVGARPIGFVDYMAVGSLREDRDRLIVGSVAEACRMAGCPLLGGETAEHPGVMADDAVDLAGAAMGVVEMGEELRPDRVQIGDVVVGLHSPNLRSNGFSLVRALFAEEITSLTDLFLDPSVIYSPAVLRAAATGVVASAAHITGGGLVGNLARSLPPNRGADIDTSTWRRPDVFDLLGERGLSAEQLYATFNMGIGFALIVSPAGVDKVIAATRQHTPCVIGSVTADPGVRLR